MFLYFSGMLLNQGMIARITRVPNEEHEGFPFAIEVQQGMSAPVKEIFRTKEEMNRRFSSLKELVSCAGDK